MSFLHDPSDLLDYMVPITGLAQGESVTAATATLDGTGSLVVSPPGHTVSHDASSVTFWITGGTLGEVYDVVVHVTTDQGRQADKSVRFFCVNRN